MKGRPFHGMMNPSRNGLLKGMVPQLTGLFGVWSNDLQLKQKLDRIFVYA
jgi:hypothetical protein